MFYSTSTRQILKNAQRPNNRQFHNKTHNFNIQGGSLFQFKQQKDCHHNIIKLTWAVKSLDMNHVHLLSMGSFPWKHDCISTFTYCNCYIWNLSPCWCRMINHAFQHVCRYNNWFLHTVAPSNDVFLFAWSWNSLTKQGIQVLWLNSKQDKY